MGDGRQSGQGGELGADGVDEALGEGGIVELSAQFCISEVALQSEEVNAFVVARVYIQVVESVRGMLL